MSEVLTDNLEAKCNIAFYLWNNSKMRVDAVLYAQARADHNTPAPAYHDNPALADHETQAQAEAIVETPKKKLKTALSTGDYGSTPTDVSEPSDTQTTAADSQPNDYITKAAAVPVPETNVPQSPITMVKHGL